jgi:hypothetical protein
MHEQRTEMIVLELTSQEAAIVTAALRQFEPYWPADATELSRAELLTGVRSAIADVTGRLTVG